MSLEFDDIYEVREGSTWLRHGETAAGSEALTEVFCSTRRCVWPKTLIFVQGQFLPQQCDLSVFDQSGTSVPDGFTQS